MVVTHKKRYGKVIKDPGILMDTLSDRNNRPILRDSVFDEEEEAIVVKPTKKFSGAPEDNL